MAPASRIVRRSYYEASARKRVETLLDEDSFRELLGPQDRFVSHHLRTLDLPVALDDGVLTGSGTLDGHSVLIAAQEGGFMGGSVGEIHGAKITGLLERARREKPAAVLLLLDTGGVRLHEANAGLVAVSEIQRALLTLRIAGVPCVALIGGVNGCFGGISIVARCCDAIIMNEEGRLGVSGPEVIEISAGVEEFDSRDRALVWRTMGGKHRYLLGEIDRLVGDDVQEFRMAAIEFLGKPRALDLKALEDEHAMLTERLARYGSCEDATDIWDKMGVARPSRLPLLESEEFLDAVEHLLEERGGGDAVG